MKAKDTLNAGALVALKSDPAERGKVVEVTQSRKVIFVQFENYWRVTRHSIRSLVVLSPSPQLSLLDKTSGRK